MKDVKVEAPSFDGQMGPTKFLYWLVDIDYSFEWYDIIGKWCAAEVVRGERDP